MLPVDYIIDYDPFLRAAEAGCEANFASFLQRRLPSAWSEIYLAATARPTNLATLRVGTFEYLCDLYRELEATGEVAIDQTIENRVIAAFGTSALAGAQRVSGRMGENSANEHLLITERDSGHFIAHSVGGSTSVNVFSQERRLNRGWSAEGKVFRRMEQYCSTWPGTFCFARPIYTDSSSVPRWLEFGLLRQDRTLWVEVFDNH
jgi:hypothetical protein